MHLNKNKIRWRCEWNIMRKWVVDKPTDTAKIGTMAVCPRERIINRWDGSGPTIIRLQKWCIIATKRKGVSAVEEVSLFAFCCVCE